MRKIAEKETEKKELLSFTIRELRATKAPIAPIAGEEDEATEQEIIFEGYAAEFNQKSSSGGWFDEVILPGAFSDSIKKDDVRCLFNHDNNFVLGRTKSKTLELKEDSKGLWFKCTAPDTEWAEDLAESVKRGDIDQCSFQFIPEKVSWVYSDDTTTKDLRQLEILKLFDVSIVTFPFYESTSVGVRSKEEIYKEQKALIEERKALEAKKEQEKTYNNSKDERAKKKLELMGKML